MPSKKYLSKNVTNINNCYFCVSEIDVLISKRNTDNCAVASAFNIFAVKSES